MNSGASFLSCAIPRCAKATAASWRASCRPREHKLNVVEEVSLAGHDAHLGRCRLRRGLHDGDQDSGQPVTGRGDPSIGAGYSRDHHLPASTRKQQLIGFAGAIYRPPPGPFESD